MDPVLIASLEAAVSAAPDDVALRLHLADLLSGAGRHADTLAHAQRVLATQPAHLRALELASRASEALGDRSLAAQYRQLHDALAGNASAAGPADDDAEQEGPTIPTPLARRPRLDPTAAGDGGGGPIALSVIPGRDDDTDDSEIERPRITLDDVAGMEQVKRRLDTAFLSPMRNPQMRELYGKSLRGGLLLYGPPGCGKTHIARATAGELGAHFLAVGLADVLDMWLGQSERNLHNLFAGARRAAPCVLFLDEVDAIGQKRSLLRHSAGRGAVVQLLTELDSVGSDNEGVFVLAATNAPWDVDPALRRPGRLDRTLLVLPPDKPARQAIFELHLRDRPLAPRIDLASLAARTEAYSGADIAHVCESAAEYAMQDSIESGTARPIEQRDLERALSEIPRSTAAWFDSARNFAMFANEGGIYDELLVYMRKHKLG